MAASRIGSGPLAALLAVAFVLGAGLLVRTGDMRFRSDGEHFRFEVNRPRALGFVGATFESAEGAWNRDPRTTTR